MVGSGQHNYKN